MKRRDLLRASFIAASGGMLSATAHSEDKSLESSVAAGLTVASAIYPALGPVAAFMKGQAGADSGASSLLSTTIQLQRQALENLRHIMIDIARVQDSIGQLSKATYETAETFYRRSSVDPIIAAGNDYAEVLTGLLRNPKLSDSKVTVVRLKHIETKVRDQRSILQVIEEGYGAEVVVAIPIACALECAIAYRLANGRKPSALKEALESYVVWLDKTLGTGPNSIDSQARRYAANHDAHIDAAMNDPTKLLANPHVIPSLPQLKIANHSSFIAVEGCMVFLNMGPAGVVEAPGASLQNATVNGGASYTSRLQFQLAVDDSLGIYKPSYRTSEPPSISRVRRNSPTSVSGGQLTYAFDGRLPPQDKNCYVFSGIGREFATDAEVIAFGEAKEELKLIRNKRGNLDAFLARLAFERSRVAHCSRAITVASNTRAFVLDRLKYLG